MPERFSLDKVYLEEEAEAEYLEASRTYASEADTLADEFEDEVERCAVLIVKHPKAAPFVRGKKVRCKVLHRFPYSLFYAVETDRIQIVAVAHQSRRPGYWRHRLKSS